MTYNADKTNPISEFLIARSVGNAPREDPRAIRERERQADIAVRAESQARVAKVVASFDAGDQPLNGTTLRILRTRCGLNEGELGSAIGLSAETVRQAERGVDVGIFGESLKRFVQAADEILYRGATDA
jgi:DNA-binding XRE family transcriptional regulator